MVLVRRMGETIIGIIWRQGKILLKFEVYGIEGMEAYWRIRFEDGIDLISPY